MWHDVNPEPVMTCGQVRSFSTCSESNAVGSNRRARGHHIDRTQSFGMAENLRRSNGA